MNPVTHLLVDLENGRPAREDIALLSTGAFKLWVFRGANQTKFDADLVEAWQPLGDRVQHVRCSKAGKNALDFHIAFVLGRLHEANASAALPVRFVVISGDGDYDPLLEYMRSLGCVATKAKTIAEALGNGGHRPVQQPAKPVAAAKAPKKTSTVLRTDMVAADTVAVLADLRTHPNNRPTTRAALARHVKSVLRNKVAASVCERVVDELIAKKHLTIEGTKVVYSISKAKKQD